MVVDVRVLDFSRAGERVTVHAWCSKVDGEIEDELLDRLMDFATAVTGSELLLVLLEHGDKTGVSGSIAAANILMAAMGRLVEVQDPNDDEGPFIALENILKLIFTVADGPLLFGSQADA